ncbi:sugar (pentulose or hexulose) kinase [Phyllobacterium ifriqiyense]|uniref:Sugar (Pentulose or hexulose) kinase n=1 Tax=Phyllobacterium ifriqiyense TaxID=314238 RepID=A0ABU0SCF7_9HYPH|nr:FGGY-family carbohydrate kinase [Phyllobacterium ifriqiyense]MDQ0998336.1 sugar (pentulose or hexulose) kinase [Phyllobacterium ifriqiyense]
MTGEALFIGIDIGTSGARAVVMTASFDVVASASARLDAFSPNHRDPAAWWSAVQSALSQVLVSVERKQIRAISIDGTSGTVLPVDASGAPLAEPLMYNDPVSDRAILDAIAANAPESSAAHGATSGLAKLMHFQTIRSVAHIIHQADWLSGHFTGLYNVSDENNALKTGYDPIERRWPLWIGSTGTHMEMLPHVLPAGSPISIISAQAAAAFDLSPSVVIVAGTTDGCASFLATGADQPGDGVSALGTTLTVKVLSDRPLFAPEFGLYSHRIGNMWLAGGASNTGGNVLAHYFDNAQIERLSASIDPATDAGLDYYPLLRDGERFPINDPAMKPRMEPRPDSDAQFLKAIFEGIANIEHMAYGRLAGLGAPELRSVRSVGGGAKNVVWSAIRARKLGVAMPPVLSEEAAAGAARLAIQGAKSSGVL